MFIYLNLNFDNFDCSSTALKSRKSKQIAFSCGFNMLNFFQDGTVQDLIEHTQSQGGHIPELNILHMFKSLCDAILAFHSLDPPLAHRDIKVRKVCIVDQIP